MDGYLYYVELDERLRVQIWRDGIWSGQGRWCADAIADCNAVLPERAYDALADALADALEPHPEPEVYPPGPDWTDVRDALVAADAATALLSISKWFDTLPDGVRQGVAESLATFRSL